MISLKKVCLNSIADGFEKFYFAFTVSKVETLNRNFLQTFAFELLTRLSAKGQLKDEYLDFLLNVRLQHLNGEWFQGSCYENSIQNIICHLPNLTKIELDFICNDEILQKIAECCSQVIEIGASLSSVTDAGLRYLCSKKNGSAVCPNLKNLFVSGSNVTDEGFEYFIRNFPLLEETDYEDIPEVLFSLHEDDVYNNLENLPKYNLISLELNRCIESPYYSDLLNVCLTVCQKLKSLKLYILREEQFDLLKSNNLEKLTIYRIEGSSEIDMNNYLTNKGWNLVSLDVSCCIISVNNLIESCPKLRCLKMKACILLDGVPNSQYSLNNLISCTFWDTKFDGKNNKAMSVLLSSSPNLEHFVFADYDLSLEMKTYILNCCENKHLKYVAFYETEIEMQFVKDIVLSCPSLHTLILKNVWYFLEDEEIEELTQFVKVLSNKPHIHVESDRIIDPNCCNVDNDCILDPNCCNVDYYRAKANYD